MSSVIQLLESMMSNLLHQGLYRTIITCCILFILVVILVGILSVRSDGHVFGKWHRMNDSKSGLTSTFIESVLDVSGDFELTRVDVPVVRLKGETQCRAFIEGILNVKFPKCRPSWLKNPTTNRCLELDMYNESIALALEYDGAQHAVYTPFFHRSHEDFEYRQQLDRLKDKICKEHGVTLIRIPHWAHGEKMKPFVYNMLQMHGYVSNV